MLSLYKSFVISVWPLFAHGSNTILTHLYVYIGPHPELTSKQTEMES
jgi:hypothetical protein